MRDSSNTVCFTCGLPTGEPPRLNHLPAGQVCPTCRDRLLASLPPAMPAGNEVPEELEVVAESEGEPDQLSPREPTPGPQFPDLPA